MKRNAKWKLIAASTVVAATTVGTFAQADMGVAFAASKASGPVVRLQETGSTLLWPLFQLWVPVFKHVDPRVELTPNGTGSGIGIAQASAGIVQIGASDAYMPKSQIKKHPGILNIPLAISAQQIMYHVPGIPAKDHLKLTGNVVGEIYLGKIQYWNAPQIQALNKGVRLPHLRIVPVHRTDGSGDTFLFTQFMTDTNTQWAQSVQFGTSVSWPAVADALGANGNQGVVQVAARTKGSIAYVGISWLNNGLKYGLGEAMLQNRAGRYLLPTVATIKSAAAVMIPSTPKDERISLIYAPGANSYPIINYEYAIVNDKQSSPLVAAKVRELLLWAISPKGGNAASFMTRVHFLPLPPSIYPLSHTQIMKIRG